MKNNHEQTKKKLLFVDDDKFLLDLYASKFTKAGYEVKTSDSPEGGLRILREGFKPDVLLADVVMPGIDGLEMLEKATKEKLVTDVAVIILTNNQGVPDDVVRAKRVGVDGYIVKAVTIPSEVVAEVEKILETKEKSL
jgi:CheY-like chemotaxis protein